MTFSSQTGVASVKMIEDERYIAAARERHELRDLAVGEHVAGGIRRPGHADGTDVVTDAEFVEVDVILEEVVVEMLDGGTLGREHVRHDPLVSVADVFRREWQENPPRLAGLAMPGEHVEEHERGGLAAVGNGDVPSGERPSELTTKQPGQGRDESRLALGRIVFPDEALE